MGAAYTKIVNYLYIVEHGEATSDSNLKKAKITCTLSSTRKPAKASPYWKHIELNKSNEESLKVNLMAGARFIHESRCGRENIAVIIDSNNHQSAIFVVAYFYILSGLPVRLVRKAVMKLRERLDLTEEFDSTIESLTELKTPKELRDELFAHTSGYTEDLLIEDLKKIYQSADLEAPNQSEIKLDIKRDLSKRDSITPQNPLNQMFRRLSVDPEKKETLPKKTPDSPSTAHRFSLKESSINDNNSESNINTSATTTTIGNNIHANNKIENDKHLSDHSSSVLKDIREDLNSASKINNHHENDINDKAKEIAAAEIKALDDYLNSSANHTNHNNNGEHHGYDNDMNNNDNKFTAGKKHISIVYAISHESTEPDNVDKYLKSTTEEDRAKTRKNVKIVHAYSKLDSEVDFI
ncbi:unnamed protein product [Trichobilharzia szidati]|nr:unnamed protein product [Trichobilharzia szidati]